MKNTFKSIDDCITLMDELLTKNVKEAIVMGIDDYAESPESIMLTGKILQIVQEFSLILHQKADILDQRDYEINRKLDKISEELKELKELESKKAKADRQFNKN